ncbi:MAG TPA: hypothetical protein VGE51_04660 [Fontimonas sp.]
MKSVRSSTSSSESSDFERLIPAGDWLPAVTVAVVLTLCAVTAMEWWLSVRGFRPTVSDSARLWIDQRARASALGSKALILVGASRVQMDLDLDELRAATGLEPVQLAVDGSSFIPVLEDLAMDPQVKGQIIVGYQDNVLIEPRIDHASALVKQWQEMKPAPDAKTWRLPTFAWTEGFFDELFRTHLRSYADGANPISTLTLRLLDPRATPQYLNMTPNRARRADYRMTDMPAFYFRRVMRNLGDDAPRVADGTSWEQLERLLSRTIDGLSASSENEFANSVRIVSDMTRIINERGGKTYFVVFPTSGLVKAIDNKRYPRELFWDTFVTATPASTLHFEDSAELKSFQCPDGSHLDYRDQARFTRALADALNIDRE